MNEEMAWPADSPEAAVRRFLTAADAEDWTAAATWIHPAAGPEYADERRRYLLERARPMPRTAEACQRLHPAASPEVVDWQVAQHAEALARRPNEIAETFAGVLTEAALMSLRPAELVRPLLEAADPRYQMRLVYAAHGYPVHPAAAAFHQPRVVRILGHLAEGPEVALVVYRSIERSAEGKAVHGAPEVIEVRRRGEGPWALPLDHEMTGRGFGSVFVLGPEERLVGEGPTVVDS